MKYARPKSTASLSNACGTASAATNMAPMAAKTASRADPSSGSISLVSQA